VFWSAHPVHLCCGTGTIGLCLARQVRRVIGVEIVADAVRDAEANAALNGISNVEFHAAPVEKVIDNIIENLVASGAKRIVAILDPPRNGVPSGVIKAIRNCDAIRTLVYVACDAAKASSNLLDLRRAQSKRLDSPPFQLTAVRGVDLFPHTPHCELIMQFTR